MLPPPTLTFTIPSVFDDLPIECRIYHPSCLAPKSLSQVIRWRKRAAIIAHPYAPLGGCYDDPVVDLLAATILKEGFVVGTFNFRGAGSSKGHTSWQSKPEQNDYISFIAFMLFYIHYITPPTPQSSASHCNDHDLDLSPVPSQLLPPPHMRDYDEPLSPTSQNPAGIRLGGIETFLLAGYSYGALITTFLPSSLTTLLTPFQNPLPLSAHASIRLRAHHLAIQQNTSISTLINDLLAAQILKRAHNLENPKTRRTSNSVRVGGEEDIRRASHDRSRSSFTLGDTPERVRKSIDRVRSIARSQHRIPLSPRRQNSQGSISSFKSARHTQTPPSPSHSASSSLEVLTPTNNPHPPAPVTAAATPAIPYILDGMQTSYLLISPPINFLSTLATLWSHSRSKEAEAHAKLAMNKTLALFGDDDVFVGVRRYRGWAEKLAEMGRGLFRWREVERAGHFWHDRDAIVILRDEVKGFVGGL